MPHLPMPWKCPACRKKIRHTTVMPRPWRLYQCPACRFEMIFDPLIKKMRPVPSNDPENGDNAPNAA